MVLACAEMALRQCCLTSGTSSFSQKHDVRRAASATASCAVHGVAVSVRFVKRMAALAMRLLCTHGGPSVPTQEIHPHGHGLKVSRIHTVAHTAKMIKDQAIRYWPNDQCVGDSVRKALVPLLDGKGAVSIREAPSGPEPARVGFGDFSPEARFISKHAVA